MPEDIQPKNETTNAVLKEKIEGLAKLTDEKLSNLKDGIGDIKTLMSGFASKVDLQEVRNDFNATIKRIEDGFAKHNEDDKTSFGGLDKGQRELRDTIKTWGGALAIIAIILPFVVPLVFRYVFKIG